MNLVSIMVQKQCLWNLDDVFLCLLTCSLISRIRGDGLAGIMQTYIDKLF